jgi:hypothetical protein
VPAKRAHGAEVMVPYATKLYKYHKVAGVKAIANKGVNPLHFLDTIRLVKITLNNTTIKVTKIKPE